MARLSNSEYHRMREASERDAASLAKSDVARTIHLALAECHAECVSRSHGRDDRSPMAANANTRQLIGGYA